MSKIKYLKVSGFLGIDEMELEADKINVFKGPRGKGKSSILEAVEKTITNKNRRTEVIKHGLDEATLFLELDDGLEIDRRIRSEKADYLKIRKADEGVPSTEKFLRTLVNGEIFRPIDWIYLTAKEQAKSILSMLEIEWSEQDIINWFGDLVDDIDYSQHILLILKNIEQKYYKVREEVNREIKELKARINALYEEIPIEYNGEEWRDKNIQEYYQKVSEAQNINKWIAEAKSLQANFEARVESIKANGESEKARIKLKFKSEEEDIKDIIELSKVKIQKSEYIIKNANTSMENKINSISNQINIDKLDEEKKHSQHLADLEKEYQTKVEQAKEQFNNVIKSLDNRLVNETESVKREITVEVENQKDLININKNKIAGKEQELISLSDKQNSEFEVVDAKILSDIEKEEIRIGKASKYLEDHEEIEIEPLQAEADKVVEMVGYLKDWDRIIEIRDGALAQKELYSKELTIRIDKARELPSELLKTANMPIKGISVDVEGRVRIGGKLIDGLSDGEKLELAMRVAKAQCGELKVICLDRFESLDCKSQEILLEEMKEDEYQYFVTQVSDTENDELVVEKIG